MGLSHIPVIHSDCNEWSDHRHLNLAAYNQAVLLLLLLLFTGFLQAGNMERTMQNAFLCFLAILIRDRLKKTYLCN